MSRAESGSKERARARREQARARLRDLSDRSQRVFDAWQAAAHRQLTALDDLADGLCGEKDEPTGRELATDLCSFWVGYWADTIEFLYETRATCLPSTSRGAEKPRSAFLRRKTIIFSIEQAAEAAEPQVVGGVRVSQASKLGTHQLDATQSFIPASSVRISTYGSDVLLSLVLLGGVGLVAGVYEGPLDLNGQPFATVRVIVT
jgi:hypothetical protein